MFLTATLALAVLMLAAEKSQVTPFAPVRMITMFHHNKAERYASDWHWADAICRTFVSWLPSYALVVEIVPALAQVGRILYMCIHEYGTFIRACCHYWVPVP